MSKRTSGGPKRMLNVVVTGDAAADWHVCHQTPTDLARNSKVKQSDSNLPENWAKRFGLAEVSFQPGGVALLGDLINRITEELKIPKNKLTLARVEIPEPGPPPNAKNYVHSFVVWRKMPKDKKDSSNSVWRAGESLGVTTVDKSAKDGNSAPVYADPKFPDGPSKADIVVLDDANFGFRDTSKLWPQALQSKSPKPWVVLKMTGLLFKGNLWEKVTADLHDRLIVILTVDDLRRQDFRISRGLSWERTAQDVLKEFKSNPKLGRLRRARHTLISFGPAGALLISTEKNRSVRGDLFFDSENIEHRWKAGREGEMYGYMVILTSSIVRMLVEDPVKPKLAMGIHLGVKAMRSLFEEGYKKPVGKAFGFPHEDMAKIIAETKSTESEADSKPEVPLLTPVKVGNHSLTQSWTILATKYRGSNLIELAKTIATSGLKSNAKGVPVTRIGDLATIDRREIEAFEGIQALMREYCDGHYKKPLCIGVFGPPGAGKSFGVEEVAKSVKPGKIQKLTFNLSQFARPEDLHGPFHQVRDVCLAGNVPLVFWDEFDSAQGTQKLGWLRYFLAPMQDGEFQQNEITHSIGKCIFVFAGGTAENFNEFCRVSMKTPPFLKARDFISRLKGFLNILGPNPQNKAPIRAASKKKKAPRPSPKKNDPNFVVRRALLFRSMMARHAAHLFEFPEGKGPEEKGELRIDRGVLKAFLEVKEFKHGARSIESLILSSALSERKKFERSFLPSPDQLAIHVDPADFLRHLSGS